MKYKVLLLEDIINQGRKGEIVEVAPGFARNFLLPQKKALLASRSTLKMRDHLQKERAEQALEDKKKSEKMAAEIRGMMFETVVKVDPDGHMYGSVTPADIVEILNKYGHTVDKKCVLLAHPIRQIGNFQINIRLPEEIEVSLGLAVKPDREIKKPEKAKETQVIEEKSEQESEEEPKE